MTGLVFGRLTVLYKLPPPNRKALWMCLCKCGAQVPARASSLKCGDKRSCGCLHYGGGRDIQEAWSSCLEKRKITESGCWEYTGGRNNKGYGKCMFGQREISAHRLSAAVNLGLDVTSGMQACHRCDNPPCFNPAHLFIGTQSDNVRDCVAKGRQKEIKKTHCASGHPYSEANTRFTKGGKRICRTCANDRLRKSYHLKNPNAPTFGPREVYV